MDTKLIYDFLKDLNKNNSLDWMKNNKKYYETAKNEFETLLFEIINGIYSFDKSIGQIPPKELIFK